MMRKLPLSVPKAALRTHRMAINYFVTLCGFPGQETATHHWSLQLVPRRPGSGYGSVRVYSPYHGLTSPSKVAFEVALNSIR